MHGYNTCFVHAASNLTRVQLDTPYVAGCHLIQDSQVQMLLVDLSHICEGFERIRSDSDISTVCECRAVGAPHQTPS